jgi:hypothetical protein
MTTGQEGFEPPTPWFVATCSSPLSYKPVPIQYYYININLERATKNLIISFRFKYLLKIDEE